VKNSTSCQLILKARKGTQNIDEEEAQGADGRKQSILTRNSTGKARTRNQMKRNDKYQNTHWKEDCCDRRIASKRVRNDSRMNNRIERMFLRLPRPCQKIRPLLWPIKSLRENC
jgi:hypothetical protein